MISILSNIQNKTGITVLNGSSGVNRIFSSLQSLLLACAASLPIAEVHAQDTLPDWSGVWAMTGGTIFDSATRTGQGGTTTPGVREHPPYNAEYEA